LGSHPRFLKRIWDHGPPFCRNWVALTAQLARDETLDDATLLKARRREGPSLVSKDFGLLNLRPQPEVVRVQEGARRRPGTVKRVVSIGDGYLNTPLIGEISERLLQRENHRGGECQRCSRSAKRDDFVVLLYEGVTLRGFY